MKMSSAHLEELKYAKRLLENPGLAAKLTNLLGAPIEKGFELLPLKWTEVVKAATMKSLQKALDYAVMTMDDRPKLSSSEFLHKFAVGVTGATGGAFGILALGLELPLSTTIMLRSIADIARSEGERVRALETKLACLEVFALGGRSSGDNGTNTGYYAVRATLTRAISEAARFIGEKGLVDKGAPAIVRLIATISARFGVVVSDKVAAQAVPIMGAAGGALVNTVFIDHFQDMARGHFIVRRLERVYGADEVKRYYGQL